MVLLTVSLAAQTAIDVYNDLNKTDAAERVSSLAQISVGDPVSHSQLVEIVRFLQRKELDCRGQDVTSKSDTVRLDTILKGSKIYTPPAMAKPEPSPQYLALMARLRQEEEQRAYERMVNPPLQNQTFTQRFPYATYSAGPAIPIKDEDDEVVYADVNRQLALIVNVLVSIIACSIALWMVARHWNTPARLALSMTGSGLVAAAEIVIFSGYISRVREAKSKEAAHVEIKEVVETWVIDGKKDSKTSSISDSDALRYRKGRHR